MIRILLPLVNDMEEMFDSDIVIRIEQDAIHLKVCDKYGDPVELSAEMAKQLAKKLEDYADIVDD